MDRILLFLGRKRFDMLDLMIAVALAAFVFS